MSTTRTPLGESRSLPGFVAGPENSLLAAVLVEIMSAPDVDALAAFPSPLVLLGSTGCGKSHLSHGIACRLIDAWGEQRVGLFTASDFRRAWADAVAADNVPTWQQSIRQLDALIIEDIDHLPSRRAVQEELASTIDALQRRRSLMVFTSAASPAHLPSCDPALVSRLHGGLTIEISALSGQSQRAFVTQLLVRLGWRHHQSLIETIVAHTTGEPATLARRVAELNQAFPRGQGATPAAVTQTLNRHVAACAPSLADILRIVSRYYSVPQRQVTSGSRQQQVVQARAMVIALARSLTPLSYEQIGSKLGGRDHTTMMHHHRKIESRLPTDVALRSAMADLKRLLERR